MPSATAWANGRIKSVVAAIVIRVSPLSSRAIPALCSLYARYGGHWQAGKCTGYDLFASFVGAPALGENEPALGAYRCL